MRWVAICLLALLVAAPARATSINAADIKEKITACWNAPPGVGGSVTLKVLVNKDGSLAAKPEIVKRTGGRPDDIFAKSAIRAVLKCAHAKAFAFDPATYDQWRELIIIFDPTDQML